MRIGVVSDTHGKPEMFRRALKQMGAIDLLIHAGDNFKDAQNMSKEAGVKAVAVVGNCDWGVPGPEEVELELEGYRILVTHGHKFGVKTDNHQLARKLKEGNYQLIIYGHSHVPELAHLSSGWLLNPGSVSSPRRGSRRSYAVVEINKSGLTPYIQEMK